MKHNCIKCNQSYNSHDPDPYYCTSCNKTRLEIAKEIDDKMANRPKKQTKSDFQKLDEAGQLRVSGGVIKCSIPMEYRNKQNNNGN